MLVNAGLRRYSGRPGSGGVSASFSATLLSTLVPQVFTGSSTPTFTRATTAYVSDWEGLLKQSISGESRFSGARRVWNAVVTTSEVFSNGAWANSGHTRTSGIADPFGGTAAFTLTNTGGVNNITYQQFTVGAGRSGRNSLWMRRRTGTGFVSLFTPNNGRPDISATLTSSWQRISTAVTAGSGSDFLIGVQTDVIGDAVDIYGAHCDDVTGQSNQNPAEYVSVGVLSAPYHGAGVDGVKDFITQNGNTVASNVVTEATGAAISTSTTLGYNSEGAATNLILWSNDLTNVAWVKTTMTTAFTSTGPDGVTNSATRCTATAGNALALQTYVAAASSRTFSLWVKRITGSGNFELTQDGAAYTVKTTTAGWTKVELNASILNATVGFRIVTNGDAFDIWCGQFEAGAVSSSPIPTTTVAVTRNNDDLTYSLASNMNNTAGTVVLSFTPRDNDFTNVRYLFGGTGGGNRIFGIRTSTILDTYDGVNNPFWTTTFPAGTTAKWAQTWTGIVAQPYKDGVALTGGATTFDGSWNYTAIGVGGANDVSARNANGNIRNLVIYTSALSAAQVAAL